MEQYIVSARKYRPSTFASVVGQPALTATLKNAIVTDRLAHAYLFCGSRGVGKTSCARIFAKTINCTSRTPDGEACNQCDSCRQFNENRSLNILELDAASNNGVDDMRQLIDQVMIPPASGKYRVFIIDEVHMLTAAAFNAFLKTLEEPPSYVIFILATTEKHKIIPTILSRCQIYDFNRITIADMVAQMQRIAANEGISAEPAALNLIARKADGAMRDALSIFDQVAASSRGNITYQSAIDNLNELDNSYYERLVDAFVAQDVATSLLIYKEVREKGFDSLFCNEADFNFRTAGNKQFLIELTLIKLCQLLSPSPDESGSDGGQLRPLESFTTSSPAPQYTGTPAQPHLPPAPVTIARPETAPVAAKTAPLPEKHHKTYTSGTLSLKSTAPKPEIRPEPVQQSIVAEPEFRSKPYTDADFASAWSAVASTLKSDPMLTSVLTASEPQRKADNSFEIKVWNSVQADIVQKSLSLITGQLRDRLSNDAITIEPRVSKGDIPPAFWTEQQVLDYLLKSNPTLSEMVTKFKMHLI